MDVERNLLWCSALLSQRIYKLVVKGTVDATNGLVYLFFAGNSIA